MKAILDVVAWNVSLVLAVLSAVLLFLIMLG